MRKEYNDRWNAPLVNPGFTLEEYEAAKQREAFEKFLAEREEKDKLYNQDEE